MSKKMLALMLVIAMVFATLTGCGGKSNVSENSAQPTTEGDSSKSKDSIVIALEKDAEPEAGLDPINSWGSGGHPHNPLVQSTLLKINDDASLGNDLATEYSVSADGLEWTFKIRSDVKFTDGNSLTAKDVAFTFNTAKATVSDLDLSMFEKAEATDDTTVVLRLNKKYSPFAYLASSIGIVPEHAYAPDTYGKNPIGSGPFILKQWDKGEQIIFEANPDYYGESSSIKKVTVVFMTTEAAYAAAQSGQVDLLQTDASYTVSPIDGYKIVAFKTVDHRGLNMPMVPAGTMVKTVNGDKEIEGGNDVTCNLAVRRAISYAIDREAVAEKAFYGYATPAYSYSPGMPWENEAAIIKYDPEKAKSIMEEDGWKKNSNGIYEKDGLVAEITVTCMDEPGRVAIISAVKEMLDEFGIKINIKGGMSWDEIDPTTYTTPNIIGGGQYSPIGDLSRFYTGKNRALYSNPTVDKHLDDGLSANSLEEAYEHFKLAAWDGTTGYITDADCPWIFIVAIKHIYFVNEDLNISDKKIMPHGHGWAICDGLMEWNWK